MKGLKLTKEEVLKLLLQNQEKLRALGVKRLGIFGSVARGEATEESDIDFVVEFEEGKKNYENFINLAFFLEELLGKEVDLLTPEAISPYIKNHLESELIFERI